ncbi:MAG: hypothetical protein QME87_01955 [Bacillota bacterium]|nr:hypothetical protein [Bacillota bacterium]
MSHLHPFVVYAFFGLLAGSALAGLVTRLSKPMAPVGGILEYAAVDLRRWRKS